MTGAVVALITIVVALAAIFANAQSVEQVATDANVGVHSETALAAAATVRNRVAQAGVLTAAEAIGAAASAEVDARLARAEEAIGAFTERSEQLALLLPGSTAEQLQSDSAAFAAATTSAVNQLRQGEAEAAAALLAGEIEPAYERLTTVLVAERNARLTDIAIAKAGAGRIANAARFLVAFLVPLTVAILYSFAARRRQHRAELEQELEKQKAIVVTKDEFIANLSHELRTPLTSIYGFTMAMLEAEADDPAHQEMTSYVAKEAAELSRMVDDLLTAAAWNDLVFRMDSIDPQSVLAQVLVPYRALGVKIEVQMEPGTLSADPMRLRQVLRNLVSNAERHGGETIYVSGFVDEDSYVIEVIDNGEGVPQDLEERLFDRFLHEGTTPLQTGSVGLGLANARMIAEKMSGSLSYERRVSLTVFELRLRLVDDGAAGSRLDGNRGQKAVISGSG